MEQIVKDFFTTNNLNIILPTVLVMYAFCLKIFKKSPPDMIDFISTFIELPMDIIILALGYISSYICLSTDNVTVGIGIFSMEIVMGILIFGLSKSSITLFQSTKRDKGSKKKMVIFSLVSYLTATGSYIISVMIYGG